MPPTGVGARTDAPCGGGCQRCCPAGVGARADASYRDAARQGIGDAARGISWQGAHQHLSRIEKAVGSSVPEPQFQQYTIQ